MGAFRTTAACLLLLSGHVGIGWADMRPENYCSAGYIRVLNVNADPAGNSRSFTLSIDEGGFLSTKFRTHRTTNAAQFAPYQKGTEVRDITLTDPLIMDGPGMDKKKMADSLAFDDVAMALFSAFYEGSPITIGFRTAATGTTPRSCKSLSAETVTVRVCESPGRCHLVTDEELKPPAPTDPACQPPTCIPRP